LCIINFMDKKGFRLNLLAQSLWGTGPVVTKLVSFNIAGSLLSGLRNGLGALVITSLMFKNQENRSSISQLTPHILIHLFFLGILAVAIPNILMVESIRASGAIIAAMLSRLEIPFGVILAGTVLKEKVSNKAKAATSLSLLSVILLSQTDMSFGTFDDANARGVGLGLIVALAFSLSTIYAKWIFNTFKIPSLLLTWVRTSMGAGISILIFVLFGGDIVQSLASISLVDWLASG
jgi:drug/metabolite transporter (DMT)-like permease